MRNLIILLILLLILSGCSMSDSPQQLTTPELELIKRLNRTNEILDEIEKAPWSERFLGHPSTSAASSYNVFSNIIARKTEARFLIENSDIALPLMLKRLDSEKAVGGGVIAYFIVFEHTKSAESIPYIADYISSLDEGHREFVGSMVSPFTYAIMAAQTITSLTSLKQLRNNSPWRTIFDRRLDIVNWLRQWYEGYKKTVTGQPQFGGTPYSITVKGAPPIEPIFPSCIV
jgi:hypothetical protein